MSWELKGNAGIDPNADFLGTTDQKPLIIKTNDTEVLRVNEYGLVSVSGGPVVLREPSNVTVNGQSALALVGYQPYLRLVDQNTFEKEARVQTASGDIALIPDSFIGAGTVPLVVKNETGNVGIGIGDEQLNTPDDGRLTIKGQHALNAVGYQPFVTLTDAENNEYRRSRIQGVHGDLVFVTDSMIGRNLAAIVIKNGTGNVGVGTADPRALLHVNGDAIVEGDIQLPGADCAEQFAVGGVSALEPGTVVSIGDDGALCESVGAYDRKVAGVVSGAGLHRPGLVLDKKRTGNRAPIALVGKVYCKVDASAEPIGIGDLLTTSGTPGHAMKASDPGRAFGAVIGKALQRMDTGRGLISILVALQ